MTRRSKKLGKVLLVLAGVLLLTGLGLEAAARVKLWRLGKSWSAEDSRVALETLRDGLVKLDWRPKDEDENVVHAGAADQRLILHPYYGYDTVAGQAMQVRAAQLMQSPAGGEFTHVVVVGGSVACVLVDLSRDRLAAGIRQDPHWGGKPVEIHVLGQGGMKQPQQALATAYALALGWKPDLVINVDGFNEVALGNQNSGYGAHPLYPSLPHWSHLATGASGSPETERLRDEMMELRDRTVSLLDFVLGAGLTHSAVAGYYTRQHAAGNIRDHRILQAEYVRQISSKRNPALHGPQFMPGLDSVLQTAVRGWKESSVSLASMCAARDIEYLHVLQPTLHDEGSKPLSKREVTTGKATETWVDGCRVGYPLLRAAGEELVQRGVPFLDKSRIFAEVEEQLYYDACHFNQVGCDLLADAITEALLRQRL